METEHSLSKSWGCSTCKSKREALFNTYINEKEDFQHPNFTS